MLAVNRTMQEPWRSWIRTYRQRSTRGSDPAPGKGARDYDRSPAVIGVLVRAYAHAGRRADALRLLAELKRRNQSGYVPAAAFVDAYLGLDDRDQVFAWLERAYQEQSNMLQLVKVHPYFDPVRGDPRFASLVDRVGLD